MLTLLKRILGMGATQPTYHYLVLYRGPHGTGECFMNNSELAKMIRDWNPRLISITPAFPVCANVVKKVASS